MSDLATLFLVLALLYVWESSHWIPRGALVLRTWIGRRWRLRSPGPLLGNARGGLVWGSPLPPLGSFLVSSPLPLSLAADGLLAFVSSSLDPLWRRPQTGRHFRWEDLPPRSVRGKRVFVGCDLLVRAISPGEANRLVSLVDSLARASAGERAGRLDDLRAQSLDTAAIRRSWDEFRQRARSLQIVANGYFGFLFLAAPAVIFRFGLGSTWHVLVAVLLAFATTTAVLFYRAHRQLYPGADEERFTHTLILSLSPPSAVRARDVLSRSYGEAFHPLAVARVFCGDDEFRALARRVVKELRHPARPVAPSSEPAVVNIERTWRRAWETAVIAFLEKEGLDAGTLLRPPLPADGSCRSYCPRCETQFVVESGQCAECGGIELVPLLESYGRTASR